MKKQSSRSKSSKSSKTVRYRFDWGNNTIIDDTIQKDGIKSNAKVIFDKNAPFFQHRIKTNE
jgi:hypothetical protein